MKDIFMLFEILFCLFALLLGGVVTLIEGPDVGVLYITLGWVVRNSVEINLLRKGR